VSYAIVVGILTHKGFLVKCKFKCDLTIVDVDQAYPSVDGNNFLIFEGALGALLLIGL